MKYYLSVFVNGEKKQTILLNSLPTFRTGRFTVGRADTNDIVLPYPSVSRNHAVLEFIGGNFEIVDAGSLNKLRVNGTAYERIRMGNGTKVTIGTSANSVMLSLSYVDEVEPAVQKEAPQKQPKPVENIKVGAAVGDKVSAVARFTAAIMDSTICMFMGIGASIIILFLLNPLIKNMPLMLAFTFLVVLGVIWLYFAFGESGESKGTMGKIALGICVVNSNTGETISFKEATKRFFAKVLSAIILFIGFFPIFGKKQTFHDYIAQTQVIKNPRVK